MTVKSLNLNTSVFQKVYEINIFQKVKILFGDFINVRGGQLIEWPIFSHCLPFFALYN